MLLQLTCRVGDFYSPSLMWCVLFLPLPAPNGRRLFLPSSHHARHLQPLLPTHLQAFLEAQNSVMAHSLSNGSTAHFDAHSDSLKQLSFRSPAWAVAAPELSLCDGGSGSSVAAGTVVGGREASFRTPGGIDDQQQNHAVGLGSQAKHWGLSHDGEGMDGEWDDTGGGSADTESAEESLGLGVQNDGRCVVT